LFIAHCSLLIVHTGEQHDMAKATKEQKKLLKAIQKNPQNPIPFIELGWIHFEEHQYNEAKQRFTQAFALQPNPHVTADATYGIALIEQQAGHYEQAKELLRRIIRECPNFPKRPDVHFALARTNDLLWRNTEWNTEKDPAHSELLQRAIDHYQQAIERRSEHHTLASFFLGKLYYDTDRYEDALSYLQRTNTGTPLENQYAFETNYLLGSIFKDQNNDLSKAQEYFQAALKKGAKPRMLAELYRQLGWINRQQGDDDQAVERFEQALTHYKDEQSEDVLEVLVNLGELKSKHHWFKMAVDYGERALQIPTQSETLQQRLFNVLAEGYYGIREYEKAEEYEQRYFEMCQGDQEKAESLLRVGAIYEHLNLPNKAADAYRKGLKFATHNHLISKLNGALGRIYLQEDHLNQAVNHLKDAIASAPNDDPHAASLYRALGDCYIKRNELEKAIEMYGTVVAKYPDSGEEPQAREEIKQLRKQFKKEIQEQERAQRAEDLEKPRKKTDLEELERLTALTNEILDEKGFFKRLKEGLAKTHLSLVGKIEALLSGRKSVDDDLIENLEELLILSDLGVATTQRIIASIQESVKRKELEDPAQVKYHLKREVQAILQNSEKTLNIEREKPFVILVIGVNGTGKTTTIGKMASKFKALGKEVMMVAGDTFRAAAIEQLEIWGERTGCEIVKHASGADPSAVMYDAIHAAQSRKVDVVIADTAGRLHTKKNLMEELKKMVRVISREMPGAPHEVLMVVDATTGQNAISQAQLFHEGVGVTGLVLTKLDGTAKGGIIVSIAHDLKIPVVYIGIGEHVEDLREFQSKEFVEALFED
jgi:fused signal recognition particle receptor